LIEFGLLVLEKKIFKNFQCIFTLSLLSPLEMGYPLHLNKLESPSPKDDLCQVWLKLAQWFYNVKFGRQFNCDVVYNVNFAISIAIDARRDMLPKV
jgi:hypothetical protein